MKKKQVILILVIILVLVVIIYFFTTIPKKAVLEYYDEGCVPTERDVQGPYFISDIPFRTSLAPPNISGEILFIGGTVFEDDCITPVPNVTLNIWHVGPDGRYDDKWYRGKIRTDEQGNYEFNTIRPERYSIRPSHIHIRIESEKHKTLVTQMYFSGNRNLVDLEKFDLDGANAYKGKFDIIFESI